MLADTHAFISLYGFQYNLTFNHRLLLIFHHRFLLSTNYHVFLRIHYQAFIFTLLIYHSFLGPPLTNLPLFFCHYHPLFLQNVHLPTRLLPVTRGLVCLSLVCGYSPDWPRHLLPEKVTSRIAEPLVSVAFGANFHSASFSNKEHSPTVALSPLTLWRLQFM